MTARRVDHYRESVWHAPELTSSEKLLLLALSRFMDFDDLSGARPGKARLQALTSMSDKSMKRLIPSVIAKGWLTEMHRGGSGKGRKREASIYAGRLPDRGHGDPSGKHDRGHGDPSTGVMVSSDWGHGDPPPSQGPAAPTRAARRGGRPEAPKRQPRPAGSTPPDATSHGDPDPDCTTCDGKGFDPYSDPVEICTCRLKRSA